MILPKLPDLQDVYDNRGKILGFALAFAVALCVRRGEKIALLESHPIVDEHTVTRIVQGPTRTEYRTIEKPGGERIVERIKYVESRDVSMDTARTETPACPAQATSPRFRVGARADPYGLENFGSWAPVVGITLGGRIDLSYSKTVNGGLKNGHGVELAYRFGQ